MAIIALTIGLSVGLTRTKKINSTTGSASIGSTTVTVNSPFHGNASTTTSTDSTLTHNISTTTCNGSNTTGTGSTTEFYKDSYTTSTGSMDVTLKLFNPNITIPYSNKDELKADLTEAVKLLVINTIKSYTEPQFNVYGSSSNTFNGIEKIIIGEGKNVGPAKSTLASTGGDKIQFPIQGSSEVPILR